ncbi:hypothetical protein RJT34_04474 [Clitoria ternatea]|uniref:O-methyltransferase dimerisation domain-containing protein n=1 Tax=Clitoria ternatea TaxID=43366 RepID=A0AAN9KPS5_CLITE
MELGVADAIHNHGKPMTLSELATALKLHPSKVGVLHRFLRLLTHNGFFTKTKVAPENGEEEGEIAYALTPPSKLLIRGKSTCLAPMVKGALHSCSLDMWQSSKKWFTEDKEQTLAQQGRASGTFSTKPPSPIHSQCFKKLWQLILACSS